MLALVAAALAVPLASPPLQDGPLTVEVAAAITTEREWLSASGCVPTEETSCAVVRAQARQGGQIALRVLPELGVYLEVEHVHEKTRAATYEGDGWGGSVGLKGGRSFDERWGLDGWVDVGIRQTDTVTTATGAQGVDDARRRHLDLGVAARAGVPDQGFMGWLGAEATPWVNDRTKVVGGAVDLGLVPMFPASAVAGIVAVSPSFSGYGAERGRVNAGIVGTLGYRTGIRAWLGASF